MKILFKHENGFFKNDRTFCEVYCFPENESFDELLNLGWLPSMDEEIVWYQAQSCRLDIENFEVSRKRRNILNKLNYSIENYENQEYIDKFFEDFYKEKKFDILDLYKNCSVFFKIKVLILKYKDEIVGFARYIENERSNIFLNLSYVDQYSKLSLGTNLFFILQKITNLQNKKYLYIYESYDNVFPYKQKFENVEIWNGREWLKK